MISVWHFLAVGAVLFGLGLIGFLTRRNFITMFLSAELMLQGAVLNFLAFGRFHGDLGGQAFGLFVVAVAACEAGLALALFVVIYRSGKTLDSGGWQGVREAGLPPMIDLEPLPEVRSEVYPTLTTSGRRPTETEGEPARV